MLYGSGESTVRGGGEEENLDPVTAVETAAVLYAEGQGSSHASGAARRVFRQSAIVVCTSGRVRILNAIARAAVVRFVELVGFHSRLCCLGCVILSDIVKLTAMYVARNGRAFLTSLKDRERTNRQFDFMDNPNHPLFTLFQAFTAAYSNIIRPKTEFLEQLRQVC